MVDEESTAKGINIKLRRGEDEDAGGFVCIADSTNSGCFDPGIVTTDTEVLSEEEYRGFWVQTKLTSEGHMEVICIGMFLKIFSVDVLRNIQWICFKK